MDERAERAERTERAERVLEFVKCTRPTASHILTFKGSLEHSAYAEYASKLRVLGLGFMVERAERALGFLKK